MLAQVKLRMPASVHPQLQRMYTQTHSPMCCWMAVTGPGSGIGRAISIRFAEEGGSIVLAGRKPDVLEEVQLICSII